MQVNNHSEKALSIVLAELPGKDCFDKAGELRYLFILGRFFRAYGGVWLDDFYFPKFERITRLCLCLGIITLDDVELTRIGYHVEKDRLFPVGETSDMLAERMDDFFRNVWETAWAIDPPTRNEILALLAPQPKQLSLF